ncbi:type II toxin-antitoxin system prevent-host-death family antitoxin [Streptomyces scabiei]|uniref:type II toxin-antitoxin system prevent-host-death family antitoxin n=1 Tax=Streptomyces scabiei TaxID=1930 RepID=UPI0038D37C29
MSDRITESTAENTRNNFSQVMKAAYKDGSIIVVTMHGNPMVVMVKWTPEMISMILGEGEK